MTEITDESDLYEVSGTKTLPNGTITPFQYLTKNIVLATGSYDQPNSLDTPGENLDCVVHSLQDMEQRINSGDLSDDPIMIGKKRTAICLKNIELVHSKILAVFRGNISHILNSIFFY